MENAAKLLRNIPEPPSCCKKCINLDYGEYPYNYLYYCGINIFIPHQKQTCKRQMTGKENKIGKEKRPQWIHATIQEE